jgi:Kdo2-lipid IVA lauroyltransferase/acyltransferase
VSASHAFEALLVRALTGGVQAMSWRASLGFGASLGGLAHRLGVRRRVAEENLALAFPERSAAERAEILRAHYRELGRVVVEYARLAELARAPRGRVFAEVRGFQHFEPLRGRGAIMLTGHFGNFELGGAMLGQLHPVDVVVRPLSNARVEAILARERVRAGVGVISADRGIRRVYDALRGGRWIAMLADQDARRQGVFVPFLGRPASTALGPARISLATGAPIVMGFVTRGADGRMTLDIEPPLTVDDPAAPDAALRLTALHVARLETWVRARPEMWFWLHRRWKTRPLANEPSAASHANDATARDIGAEDVARQVGGRA